MGLIKEISTNYDSCLALRCKNEGCKLRLDKISSNHVIISGTQYQKCYNYTDKLCDFILFDCMENIQYRLAVIEMKGGKLDKDDIKVFYKQLQNGANIGDKLSKAHEVKAFIPVTVKKKTMNPMASKTLLMNDNYKVRFRNFFENIKIVKHNNILDFP